MTEKRLRLDKEIRKKVRSRFSLTILFTAIIFAILLLSLGTAVLMLFLFMKFGIIEEDILHLREMLLIVGATSLVFGTLLAMTAGKLPLKPLNLMITQMNRLASGDFKARLHFGKTLHSFSAFAEAEDSFNKMAGELGKTELLRSDFINNFSHEFKTPIVSIAGFAKLLKRGNLTEQQREEYIDVIEEEALRLSCMATNVLNLTKVENQTILTDVTRYNLSEQLRSAVLLLESKWTRKHLELRLDFAEYEIEANEELLKQVWINLVDNAVKFSPDYGLMEVTVEENADSLTVRVTNLGEIPSEAQQKIWNKFYQAEESHASEGNGIGLAIVKCITQLHGGTAAVRSENGAVTFEITLPKEQ